jgi:hypothetical protein
MNKPKLESSADLMQPTLTAHLREFFGVLVKDQAEVFEACDLLQIVHVSWLAPFRRLDLADLSDG